jgi:hypothetical protein
VARILIVGGGCRGRRLAATAREDGHVARITTRGEGGREAVERAGAECWIGTPLRLATLRGALDRVAVALWLLGNASGEPDEVAELFGPRLELFMTQAIDTTVRGVVYEAAGSAPQVLLDAGEERARAIARDNAIPFASLRADPSAEREWLAETREALAGFLGA